MSPYPGLAAPGRVGVRATNRPARSRGGGRGKARDGRR